MLTAYIQAAMRHAHYEIIDDPNSFFGSIPCCPGVWASAPTLEACREALQAVLEDWLVLGLRLDHAVGLGRLNNRLTMEATLPKMDTPRAMLVSTGAANMRDDFGYRRTLAFAERRRVGQLPAMLESPSAAAWGLPWG
jgi:predicted RNase H-like HicB family nuclease